MPNFSQFNVAYAADFQEFSRHANIYVITCKLIELIINKLITEGLSWKILLH